MASRKKATRKRSTRGTKAREGAAQVPPTRQTGPQSATGAALREGEQEIPSGEDRGSKVEIVGNPKADYIGDGQKPEGAQAEPAIFTSNGQVPHGTVGSPSGPVPVMALGLDAEASEKKMQDALDAHAEYVEGRLNPKKLPPETISRLGRAELHAIGQLRGYEWANEGSLLGTRRTRLAFQKSQDEDDSLED